MAGPLAKATDACRCHDVSYHLHPAKPPPIPPLVSPRVSAWLLTRGNQRCGVDRGYGGGLWDAWSHLYSWCPERTNRPREPAGVDQLVFHSLIATSVPGRSACSKMRRLCIEHRLRSRGTLCQSHRETLRACGRMLLESWSSQARKRRSQHGGRRRLRSTP